MLLAEGAVVGAGVGETIDDHRLGAAVDLGDLGRVLLPVDLEVAVVEMGQRERVDLVRDVERERQFGGQVDGVVG